MAPSQRRAQLGTYVCKPGHDRDQADGRGTRVVSEADFRLEGVYRPAEPFLGRTFRVLGAKALAGLKATLDSA